MTSAPIRHYDWMQLDARQRQELLRRPAQRDQDETLEGVRRIVDQVRREGDPAVRRLTEEHDHVRL